MILPYSLFNVLLGRDLIATDSLHHWEWLLVYLISLDDVTDCACGMSSFIPDPVWYSLSTLRMLWQTLWSTVHPHTNRLPTQLVGSGTTGLPSGCCYKLFSRPSVSFHQIARLLYILEAAIPDCLVYLFQYLQATSALSRQLLISSLSLLVSYHQDLLVPLRPVWLEFDVIFWFCPQCLYSLFSSLV